MYSKNITTDPNIFWDQYGNPRLVYLEIRGSKEMMGMPGLLGMFYWNGGSRGDALEDGDLEETVSTMVHEIEHGNYAHSETQHRLMESNSGFSDPRNYRKARMLLYGISMN